MVLKEFLLVALIVGAATADRPWWRKMDSELTLDEEILGDVELGKVRRQDVDETYRLPKVSRPTHYDLHLRTAIHQNNRDFQGTVHIHLDVLEQTNTITVHNRQLSILRAYLYEVPAAGGEPVELEQPTYSTDTSREHLSFVCSRMLPVGSYILKIEYSGRMQNNNNMGFFASSYLDNLNNRRYLASSKFEPTHARSAYPSYDEPLLKATFTLSITHSKDYHAVANMPQAGDPVPFPDDSNYVTTTFDKSTKMSTYLLAFAITDFCINAAGRQTVYARENVCDETAFPLEAGNKILDTLGEYMDVDYYEYMPKMTQIAIPDRGTGAMENWGLVAYGEPVLLFNPAINTYRTMKSVTTIIAHEFAHQWFGNLVSPNWWDVIWLNEGFATVYEYLGAQLAYPEHNIWDLFTVEVIHNAFGADASETVRPMIWSATVPNDIAGLFDTVAYDKSGSVLNMFRVALGDDNWRAGLNSYMLARRLDGATEDDLYAGLQSAIDGKGIIPNTVTVKQLMDSWTTEPGFPVLNVRRSYNKGEVIISQERYLSNKKIPGDHLYHIPYNYVSQGGSFDITTFDWLSSQAAKITTGTPDDQWLIFNKQQSGYYRVNYDLDNWNMIIDALLADPTQIHHINRAQLLNDVYNLGRTDRLDLGLALRMMTYLKRETEYAPWTAASTALTYFNNKLRGTPLYAGFQNYVTAMLEDVYGTLAVDSVGPTETLLHKYLKQLISTWACRIGHPDCLDRTKQALLATVQANAPLLPDIATVVYCNGMIDTTDEVFVWVYNRMMNSRSQAERSVLIDSLACSRKTDQLQSLLMTALGSGSEFDSYLETERTRIVSAIYGASREGVDALIDFLMTPTTVDEFVSRLGQGQLNSAVSNIASRTNNQQELQRLETLLTSLGNKITASVASSARASVENNFAWFDTLEGVVTEEFVQKFATAN